MNYLIDTHILLWFINGDDKLLRKYINVIENPINNFFVSVASLWEIAIKVCIGKLQLSIKFDELENYLLDKEFQILEINFNSLKRLVNLPLYLRIPSIGY